DLPLRCGSTDPDAWYLACPCRCRGPDDRQDGLLPGGPRGAQFQPSAHPCQGQVDRADGAGRGLVPGACGRAGSGGIHQLVRGPSTVRAGGGAGRIAADALVGVRAVVPGGPVPAVLGRGGDPGAAAGGTVRAVTELSAGLLGGV